MGTWIEMKDYPSMALDIYGRSLRGNVDRNDTKAVKHIDLLGRSLRGNVDRNKVFIGESHQAPSRSLRGNVDRNLARTSDWIILVRSFPTWERG